MAGVDASIPLGAHVEPANPLATLGNYVGIVNAANQNRLFNQQYQANIAAGQAAKGAIDPATGMLDPAKYGNALASGPASYMLPQFMQQNQQMQAGQLGINQQQLELAQKKNSALTNALAPLMATVKNGGQVSQKDVMGAVGTLAASGFYTPQALAARLTDPNDPLPSDPSQLSSWVAKHYVQGLDTQAQIQALMGTPQGINLGGQTAIVSASPLGGVQNLGVMPNTLPPTTQRFNPQTRQMEFVGGTNPLAPAVPDQSQPTTPQDQPQIGNGRYPGLVGGGSAPAGGIPAAPPLGAPEAAAVTGTESAKQGINLQQAADQVPLMKGTLDNLDAALNQFTSGPGQDWKRVAKTFVNANFPEGLGFDPKSISSQEEFNKQAAQLAQQQFQALGGTGTDAKLDSAMHTSPNEALSKMGNKNIIALLKGNADAISAKNEAWQGWQQAHGPESYGQFSTAFNKVYDPRVFQFQYMKPDQRKEVLDSMSKGERNKFMQSTQFALQNNWIQPPGR